MWGEDRYSPALWGEREEPLETAETEWAPTSRWRPWTGHSYNHTEVITDGDPMLLTLQGFLGLFSQHLSMGPVSLSQDPQHRLGFLNLPFHYQPPCGLQKQTGPATGRVVEWIVKPFLWMKGREATTSEGPGGWW